MAEAVVEKQNESELAETAVRVYEIGYHVVPTKPEAELEKTVNDIRSLVEKAGGKFLAEGAPALTKLSYTISMKEGGKRVDHDRGYFGWIKFEAPVSAAREVETGLSGKADIMRSVLFQTVRQETRARFRTGTVREVKRSDVLRAAPRVEEVSAPVSEEELDKAIEDITTE